MRAIDVEIGARSLRQRAARRVIPHREARPRPIGPADPRAIACGQLKIAQLRPDGGHRARQTVAFLALVAIGNGIADVALLPGWIGEGHGHARAGQPEVGIAAIGAPDIGQRGPATRPAQQHAGLNRAKPIVLAIAKIFDDRRAQRKIDQPVAMRLHLCAGRQIDHPAFFGIIGKQRGPQCIGNELCRWAISRPRKKAEIRQARGEAFGEDQRGVDWRGCRFCADAEPGHSEHRP